MDSRVKHGNDTFFSGFNSEVPFYQKKAFHLFSKP